jgi:phosphoribosylaminoimidazolecarboxamide formyltransferase/IMP cyclohydrolase
MGDAALPAAVALATGLLGCLATRALIPVLRRSEVLDYPNERSSHLAPTPRGGGIALIGSLLLAWIALGQKGFVPPGVIGVSVGAGLLSVVSWIDDLRGVSPLVRLVGQGAAVAIGVFALPDAQDALQAWLGRVAYYTALGVLWIWWINLFNFMDGIDGLAGSEAAAIGGGLLFFATLGVGADPGLAALSAAIIGAAIGFLVWNWSPARIFLGDVGSAPLGFLLGFLLLDLAVQGPLEGCADPAALFPGRCDDHPRLAASTRRAGVAGASGALLPAGCAPRPWPRGRGQASDRSRHLADRLWLGGGKRVGRDLPRRIGRDRRSLVGRPEPRPLRLAAPPDRRLYPGFRENGTMTTSSLRPIRRALVSVSDKTGLIPFVGALVARGVAIISTGGSARTLAAAGLPVTEVAAITGVAEFLDGRVKTLHPAIHAGLLARRDRTDHLAALTERGIAPIDLLVCNLYPFTETVASGASPEDCTENIDIGGPALIRAAAKNHEAVTVVTNPADYAPVLAEFAAGDGVVGAATRRALARKAFAMTAAYDAAIAEWMGRQEEGVAFLDTLVLTGRLAERLRYGENPHQAAAFFRSGESRPGVATARQLQGKELSYNNYGDADAAFELVAEFAVPAVAIVKHANPCGAAVGATLRAAWDKALACDPQSAFGGIVALNRPLDAATAEAISRLLIEVVIAPQAEDAATALLARRTGLRLLVTGGTPDPGAPGRTFRSLSGGILVQERDRLSVGPDGLRMVTRRGPSDTEIADLLFAMKVVKHVKSNAIVFARSGATVGIGAGQMSRVDSVRIAAAKAAETGKAAGLPRSPTCGSVLASDAFFPFADGVEAAIEAGVTAVIQPGGSVRDKEVIAAADAAGIAMVLTGMRHFRH